MAFYGEISGKLDRRHDLPLGHFACHSATRNGRPLSPPNMHLLRILHKGLRFYESTLQISRNDSIRGKSGRFSSHPKKRNRYNSAPNPVDNRNWGFPLRLLMPTFWGLKMTSIRIAAICLAGFAVVALENRCEAQQLRKYASPYSAPAGPTVAPQMNLFRNDVGAMFDPYNQYVQPAEQVQSRINQVRRQDDARFSQLRSQVGQLQGDMRQIRETGAAPTGTGSRFMNYGQYFQTNLGTGQGGGAGRARGR